MILSRCYYKISYKISFKLNKKLEFKKIFQSYLNRYFSYPELVLLQVLLISTFSINLWLVKRIRKILLTNYAVIKTLLFLLYSRQLNTFSCGNIFKTKSMDQFTKWNSKSHDKTPKVNCLPRFCKVV